MAPPAAGSSAGSPPPLASPAEGADEDAVAAAERVPSFSPSRDLTRVKFWAQGPRRLFFSTAIDLGYLYLRPRVSVGYGHPFWSWVGVDANPQVSINFLGAYAGLRAALPFVDVRAGGRYVFPFQRSYLAPRASFDRLALEDRQLARSTYLSLEAELSGGIPAGPGSVLFLGTFLRVNGVPAGTYLYEETMRVVMNPSDLWRGRLGYAIRLGVEGKISVGLVAEVLHSSGRDAIVRSGLVASAVLSNHLEVLGSFIPPILGPDTLGIAGGDFGQLGLRYRWATGISAEPIVVPVR